MSMRLRPARLVNGFIERFTTPKFEMDRSIYEQDFCRWQGQRKILHLDNLNDTQKGFVSVATLESWLATPIPDGKPEIEQYITPILEKAVAFAKVHNCDMIISE